MPRHSRESFSAARVAIQQIYPESPANLSKRQAEVWKGIVLSRPADYFDAAGKLLLAALCAHTESFERLTRELQRELESDQPADARLKLLTGMRDTESRAMSSLATRLRLTAQARYTPLNARRATIDGAYAQGPKPWEERRTRTKSARGEDSAV